MSAIRPGLSPDWRGALAEGGLLMLSTPNRTALSHIALITIGEGTGADPEGDARLGQVP